MCKNQDKREMTPALVYLYFTEQQKYISDRAYDDVMNKILYCILASDVFGEDDYGELYKVMQKRIQWHCDKEYHYRVAIENRNNTAWKSIEKFNNRKPYIFSGKRMYEGFKFKTRDGQCVNYIKCTGWNDDGKIKFIVSPGREIKLSCSRYRFTHEEFNNFFKSHTLLHE